VVAAALWARVVERDLVDEVRAELEGKHFPAWTHGDADVPRAHATGLLAVALLATAWAGAPRPRPGGPRPVDARERASPPGRADVAPGGGRGVREVPRRVPWGAGRGPARFVYRLIPQARESCTVSVRLEITTLGDDSFPPIPAWPRVTRA